MSTRGLLARMHVQTTHHTTHTHTHTNTHTYIRSHLSMRGSVRPRSVKWLYSSSSTTTHTHKHTHTYIYQVTPEHARLRPAKVHRVAVFLLLLPCLQVPIILPLIYTPVTIVLGTVDCLCVCACEHMMHAVHTRAPTLHTNTTTIHTCIHKHRHIYTWRDTKQKKGKDPNYLTKHSKTQSTRALAKGGLT